MVSSRFEEEELRKLLGTLPQIRCVAFAAACAARLENTARAVSGNEDMTALLSQTLDGIVNHLKDGSKFQALQLEEKLLDEMPDEDADPEITSAVAEDAAAAAVYTLRVIQNGDPQDAVWAARRAYDTADRDVLRRLNVSAIGDAMEAYILQHPVVQTELQRQWRDLSEVSAENGKSAAELAAVVVRARSENILSA